MKQVVCAVMDVKAEVFGRPFLVRTQGESMRMFLDECNRANDENQFYKHPEDFILYHIADFNDETGEFTNISPIKMLVQGKQASVIEAKISKV